MTTNARRPQPKRISDIELKRRWKAVREKMKERNLDFLIMQNSSSILPGNVKWFTDISFRGPESPTTVIFPREDDMTVIQRALRPARVVPPPPDWRGVKNHVFVPVFWTSLTDSQYFEAEKAVDELRKHKNCRIGWVGLGYFSAAFYKYVVEHLTNAKFEDATDMIDLLKAIKSDEEIGLLRETCELEDRLFDYVLSIVKPGETDTSIRAKIIDKCNELGAGTNIVVMASPANISPRSLPPGGPRLIQSGDQVTLLLETSSPTSFWGEFARTICLGKVPAKLQEQFELAKEAQQLTLNMLKPGKSAGEFWEANNTFMRDRGYPEEIRLYAHGQGLDMVERPCLAPDETMKIEARMFMAVHPEVKSDQAFGWICDNFLVKESGEPELFHKTPQKIFTL